GRAAAEHGLTWVVLDLGSGNSAPIVLGFAGVGTPDHYRFWDANSGEPIGPTVVLEGVESYRLARARDGGVGLVVFRKSPSPAFGALPCTRRLSPLPQRVGPDLTLQPDGRTLVSVAGDGTVRWWDPATGQPLGPPWRPARGTSPRLTPDGRYLVMACTDG